MKLTDSQLSTLRTRPHQANIYMSIYRPKTLFSCQVASGTYSDGDLQIEYINGSGSYLNVYPDVTALIGSSAGEEDYGRLRVRGITGTYIDFAENAINWQGGLYLTLIDQIDVQAIYPRIIPDPDNDVNVIFYKDYDIPYTNQNRLYGSFPCAGPHRAAFLNPTASIYYTATGSANVLGTDMTYLWTFEGGTPSGSTLMTPGNVTYDTPGHYHTSLQVTGASGTVDTTYRYVSMYDRPDRGANVPILEWEMIRGLSGSRSEGGYETSFRVYQNLNDVQPNAIVVLFTDNFYGDTNINLGGNAVGNSSIFFVGYIIGDSIKFDYQSSSVEFSVASISQLMKDSEGFSVSCESKASPTTWFELYEMNVSRAVYHYLRWHSTVLKVTDFQYTGDERLVQYFDSDRGSLYDAVDNFIRTGMLGELVCDRQGKLWAEISPFGQENPIAGIPTNFILQKQDWVGDVNITERRISDASFVELGGIAYYGVATNTFSALLSNAPSTVPLYHGKGERKEGLILSSQEQLNQLSGNYLAHGNTRFPEINLSLAGIYTNVDIAPQEKYYLVISPSDTIRNRSLQAIPYVPSGMEWGYSPINRSLNPTLSLSQIATGTAGVTVAIPVTPPESGYSYPDLQLPPLPTFPPVPIPPGGTIPSKVLLHDLSAGMIYTENFDAQTPNYITVNGGLTAAQYQAINWFCVCDNGAFYVASVPGAGGGFLARAPSVGGIFTVLYEASVITEDTMIWGVGQDKTSPERIGFIRGASGALKFYVGANGSWSAGLDIGITGLRNDAVSFGDDKWALTYYSFIYVINSAGTAVLNTYAPTIEINHHRAGSTAKMWANGGGLVYTDDNWASSNIINSDTTILVGTSFQIPNYIASDPTGQYLMTRAFIGARGKSSDYGFTWTLLGNLPAGNYWFAYSGINPLSNLPSFIAAGGTVVRFSPDFGDTWENKESASLFSINPIPNINMVRAIGF